MEKLESKCFCSIGEVAVAWDRPVILCTGSVVPLITFAVRLVAVVLYVFLLVLLGLNVVFTGSLRIGKLRFSSL